MKTCSKCKEDKDEDQFFKDKQKSDGLTSSCKVCHTKKCLKYAKNNRKKFNANQIKYKYGISNSDYNRMLSNQNFKCAICKISHLDCSKQLCVDHDHKTGKIRGLLCINCNFGIGYFKDNTDKLKSAIVYLASFK